MSASEPQPNTSAEAGRPTAGKPAEPGHPDKLLRASSWGSLFAGPDNVRYLEHHILPAWLRRVRWFGGKASTIQECRIDDRVYLPVGDFGGWLGIIRVGYRSRPSENYTAVLGWLPDGECETLPEPAIVAPAVVDGVKGQVVDGLYVQAVRDALFADLVEGREFALGDLVVRFLPGRQLGSDLEVPPSKVLNAEQSNSSVVYDNRFIAKIYRKVEYGINPDLEVTRFLTEQAGFNHIPAYRGAVEMLGPEGKTLVLTMFQDWVPNQGDAWSLTLEQLQRYYQQLEDDGLLDQEPPAIPREAPPFGELPEAYRHSIGEPWYGLVELLAERTAGMHRALASGKQGGAFTAEPQEPEQQERFARSTKELARSRFEMLRGLMDILKEDIRREAESLLEAEPEVERILMALASDPVAGRLTRIHGDYHLGQVLFTGDDFVVLDFEGEPDKPHSERRLKHSPLKDVAGMVRSFHYAVHAALQQGPESHRQAPQAKAWASAWYSLVADRFLQHYLNAMLGAELLPADRADTMRLLRAFILEKAVYELGYELNNRPEWVAIPLLGIRHIVNQYAVR
jgi:maltose alpha-D-glucosyltransferase/alpha-amylase